MTPASFLRGFKLPDCNNHQGFSCSISSPQCQPGLAASCVTGGTSKQTESRHAALQDPFAYYKAFLDTSLPPETNTTDFTREDDGYACHTGVVDMQGSQMLGDQQQARARAVPHSLAVRLANRSNGAPLATIVEQGSYSTLNSHGSLLGVGRFPSLRAAENASPNHATSKRSRSLDEKALYNIQEDAFLERGVDVLAETLVMPPAAQGHGTSCSGHGTNIPAKSDPVEYQQTLGSPTSMNNQEYDADSRWTNGFFRGVLHNVRAASRTRSRSSSMAYVDIIDPREDRSDEIDISPKFQDQDRSSETPHTDSDKFDAFVCVQSSWSSATSKRTSEPQPRSRKISKADSEPSIHVHPTLIHIPPLKLESDVKYSSARPLALCSLEARSRECCLPADTALPEPRDVALENGTIKSATLLSQNRDYASAQQTFEKIPAPRNDTPSLTEVDRARYASRNVSFCSTMSTSYSGTVLGVDLDLQHDPAHQSRRSRSATPVWFTSQVAEPERQASSSESPEWRQPAAAETTSRSITSSALTSLLPIAAASGIVRPNYNTPKISFYSPSGNLIQPESDSALVASPSEGDSSLTTTTSYYKKTDFLTAQNALSRTVCLSPARPLLIPVATPPISTAQLPAHLRHHHNHHRRELSQISSCESFIADTPAVKGCDGVVRNNSFSPRSGIARSHHNDPESEALLKHRRSTKSIVRSLKSEANFYTSRFVNQILSTSCTPSLPPMLSRSRTARHRGVANTKNTGMYATESHSHSRIAAAHVSPNSRTNERALNGMCGPRTAHMLRVCFCQPYDGAGKRGPCRDAGTKMNADGDLEPNVRIARREQDGNGGR